ncbi:L-serine ammonia-lyase, iron-sulfur-dependent, subunit alpha [Acholeplasma vituli]|uniref:L-serine ammonia-lyase n=1 Tax=Paracholeplasma vituli TaxID=69473 RepID=A0ABT2PZZ4_9MOLU|nr:L-serine ammonia-lyase, iron-sulfur-dependent, subunit alpha [Paracholeplasma vituli]MCU0105292.1 L-serine ammonia-lyase, iron-sulfur-dependent, subunit alpha [Paracholeplasma vituli]
MQSLRKLYKIGHGPSSSHTMGPGFAASYVKEKHKNATRYVVTLYNSLALTGKGHLTDAIIEQTLSPIPVEFKFNIDIKQHPNFFVFEVYHNETLIDTVSVRSIGGGDILYDNEENHIEMIYPHQSFDEIKAYCKKEELDLYTYVKRFEGPTIDTFLNEIWTQLQKTVETGLKTEGVLPGDLKVQRKAKTLMDRAKTTETDAQRQNRLVSAYAFAASEENGAGGIIVTAPTCGASGVLPAVLYYMKHHHQMSDQKIIESLAVAGIIGNIIKTNATISGAVGGCQAEVGSACSMAAAAHAYLSDLEIEQIEYAAEIAMEHHLGLTCDPIDGYVQIPCIERNAVAGIRAINASGLSEFLTDTRKISFDMIVHTMYQTGLDMHPKYKETAEAGMAYFYKQKK